MQILKKKHHNISFIDLKLPKFLVAEKQKLFVKKVHGIGLHTGNRVSMTLSPAPPNTGFSFRLIKNGKKVNLKAHYTNVKSTELCTLISDNNGNTVSTVEHILSALYGLEIDNILLTSTVTRYLFVTVHL